MGMVHTSSSSPSCPLLLPLLLVLCMCATLAQDLASMDGAYIVHFQGYHYQVQLGPIRWHNYVERLAANPIDGPVLATREEAEFFEALVGGRSVWLPILPNAEATRLVWTGTDIAVAVFDPAVDQYRLNPDAYTDPITKRRPFSREVCIPTQVHCGGQWSLDSSGPESCARQLNGFVNRTRAPTDGAVRFNNSYYVLVDQPVQHPGALSAALQAHMLGLPGHLVSIDTPEENAFLAGYLRKRGVEAAWTGAQFTRDPTYAARYLWAWRMADHLLQRSHTPYVFATRDCGSVCNALQAVPGTFHNFSEVLPNIRRARAGATLLADGSWGRASSEALVRYPYLLEFPVSRPEELFEPRHVDHKTVMLIEDSGNASTAASLAASHTLGGVRGHLPTIESNQDNVQMGRFVAQACRESFRAAYLGVWTNGLFQDGTLRWTAGFSKGPVGKLLELERTGSPLYRGLRYFNLLDTVTSNDECMAAERLVWRFGDCSLVGFVVAEFERFTFDGDYLRLAPLVAGFPGMLQASIEANPRNYTRYLPMPKSAAELNVLQELLLAWGLDQIYLGATVSTGAWTYLDGTLVARLIKANKTTAAEPFVPADSRIYTDGKVRCLRFTSAGIMASGPCSDVLPAVYRFTHLPSQPAVLARDLCQLNICECQASTKTVLCPLSGLHSVALLPPDTESLLAPLNLIATGWKSFAGLPRLRSVNLEGNGIMVVPPGTFANHLNLTLLDLNENILSELPDVSTTRLRTIELASNVITQVKPGRLPSTLVTLSLAKNQLTRIPSGAFANLDALTILDLSNNAIATYDAFAFDALPLQALQLHGNPCDAPCYTATLTTAAPKASNNEGGSSSGGGTVVAAAGAAAAVACLLLAACVVVALRRRHHSRVSTGAHFEMEALLSDKVAEAFHARFPQVRLEAQTFEYDFSHKVVAWPELQGLDVAKLQGHRQATWHRRRGQAEGGAGAVAESVLVLLRGAGQQSPEGKRELLIEARLLEYLKHPSVVPLLGVTTRGPLYMVLAHEHESDLRTFLRRQRATSSTRTREVTPQDLVLLATQVAAALSFLEQRSIAHCSLKASNCLVRVGEQLSVKLGTLGTATHADPTAQCVAGVSEDDVPWYSPEVLRYGQFSSKSDVFAFGVLLYEMASFGKQPWGLSSMAEVRTEVLAGSRLTVPAQCPKLLLEVMLQGWQDKAQLRPSFATLYSDLLMRRAGRGSRAVRPRLLGEEDIDFVRDLSPGGGIRLYSVKADGALVAGHMAQGQSRATQILAEARLLRCLRHENVARLLGVVEGAAPVMLTEYFGEGSLRAFLRERDGLARKQVLGLGGDVALGVQYLAACQIVHRQVSSSNCFLREGRVVLAGFGLTRQVVATEEYLSTRAQAAGELGVREMAPESIQRRVFSKASDVFCLGVVLHEVFHGGRGPFEGVAAASFLSGLAAGRLPAVRTTAAAVELMDAGVARMLGACLQMLPEGRPRAGDVAGALADAVAGTDRWEYEGELTFVRELGAGAFGTVAQMVASDLPAPGGSMVVAVKVLLDDSEQGVAEFMAETRLMKKLQHPNLTSLLGVCTRSTPLRMILEFQSGGSLLDYLEATPTSEEERLLILNQIACGMASLHEHNIIHRDLAARNCLVGDGLQIKVADFGLSRETTEEDYYRMATERALPLRWIAPEILQTMKFTRPSDVWSFGILIFELHNPGTAPFESCGDEEVILLLRSPDFETRHAHRVLVPPTTAGAVQRHCLVLAASTRPTFPTLCSMLAPWQSAPAPNKTMRVEHDAEESTAV